MRGRLCVIVNKPLRSMCVRVIVARRWRSASSLSRVALPRATCMTVMGER